MQHHGDDSTSSSFVDYGALFRRQWMVILACVLLGVIAGIGYLALQSPSYTSSTTVLVRSAGISAGEGAVGARTTGDINLDTESQIARSAKIASAVRTELGAVEPPQRLAARLSVRVPPNSEVLVFDFKAQNAELAARGSTAFAEAYLADRQATAEAARAARRQGLQTQADALSRQLDLAITQIAAAEEGSRERALATASRDSIERRRSAVDAELASLELLTISPGEIITPATPGKSDAQTRTLIAAVSGPFAGLLLGIGLALLRDRTSSRLREEDLAKLTSHPVIARMVGAARSDKRRLGEQAATRDPAVTRLRNILMHLTEPPPRVVLVAAAGKGSTADHLAPALATALAEDGVSVAWVQATTEAAEAGEAALNAMRAGQGLAAPHHIPLGPKSPVRSVETFDNDLPGLLEQYQLVIVETDSPNYSPDAQTLAPAVDVVLLVVDARRTSRRELSDAVDQLDSVRASNVRLVLMDEPRRHSRRPGPSPSARDSARPRLTIPILERQKDVSRTRQSDVSESQGTASANDDQASTDNAETAVLLLMPDRSVDVRSIDDVAKTLGRKASASAGADDDPPQSSASRQS